MDSGELISRKYRLLCRLGEGGMGEVWSARNVRTDHDFAIKFLSRGLATSREALERFVQEARATGQIRHPGIVRVYDAGQTQDGLPYLVMELLTGESLEARLRREGSLEPAVACRLVARVAEALHHAHRAGVVHRDLSSANVFLEQDGDPDDPQPRILDFGVSKITGHEQDGRVRTGDGAVLGSPAYMSPEQAQGAECVDARSDVWSLGVLLYESLSGRLPFAARNYNALMVTILSRPHSPLAQLLPDVDPEIASVVEACLIKDREHRTQSAQELSRALAPIVRRLRAAPPSSRPRPGSRRVQRTHPLLSGSWRSFESNAKKPQMLLAGGTFVGIALGLGLGILLASPGGERLGRGLTGSRIAARELAAAPRVTPMRSQESAQRSEPETDLARAMARGLGVRNGRKPHRLPAPSVPVGETNMPEQPGGRQAQLVILRRNPY